MGDELPTRYGVLSFWGTPLLISVVKKIGAFWSLWVLFTLIVNTGYLAAYNEAI